MSRMRLVSRCNEIGLWFPHLQEWWNLSPEAVDYLQGRHVSNKNKREIENELRKLGILEDVKVSNYFPVKTIQTSPPYKPPTVAIIHIIWNCNVDCPDCYIKNAEGWGRGDKLTLEDICSFLESFANAGGLFADISGGEPLLRNDIYEILQTSYDLGLRTCLVTNGTLLDKYTACNLSKCVDQVTISIDGHELGHDNIRGDGTFSKSINALRWCYENGIATGATTVLRNLEFNELKTILQVLSSIKVQQWNLTALRKPWDLRESNTKQMRPLTTEGLRQLGFLAREREIEIIADEAILEPSQRTKILAIEIERQAQRWHSTLTVMPDGNVVPCVFHPCRYANIKEMPAYDISVCQKRKDLLSKISDTTCSRCLG